jgi:exosortase D (VPLPA-CTERM-specific)
MSTPRRYALRFPTSLPWRLAILGTLSLWLYWPTLLHLVGQWWHDPNFSHGFFVPLFSGFVIWQERDRLTRILPRPAWSALLVLGLGLAVLVVGRLGAELFLDRSSILLVLASVVILFGGWALFRAVLFPWAFLLLMIPIPSIVFNQITFPLQLLASQVAAAVLPILGVPVLREGNVINLPAMPLEVAEACSGIRSLMSLLALAIIYGYLTEKRLWVRWFLAIAAIPITVLANDVRIVGTGLLVQYWDPEAAEGYFHASWGWIIFVVSLLTLYALHAFVGLVFPEDELPDEISTASVVESPALSSPRAAFAAPRAGNSLASFILAALLVVSAATFLHARGRSEVFPPRLPLKQFPVQLDARFGTGIPIDQDTLEVLGAGDFLHRYYQDADQTPTIDLFIAYFRSQRAGDTIHSPKNCLPGAGWTQIESRRVTISTPGHSPFPATRYIIARGDSRQVVLYWYWAHDRGVASEYWAKFYLVADSIKMNRSDGSLVRLITPLLPGETPDTATQRLHDFAADVVPQLQAYIPW